MKKSLVAPTRRRAEPGPITCVAGLLLAGTTIIEVREAANSNAADGTSHAGFPVHAFLRIRSMARGIVPQQLVQLHLETHRQFVGKYPFGQRARLDRAVHG